jgi:phospholipid/cholesterol/gamma-HCH transport system ATP-binding protein
VSDSPVIEMSRVAMAHPRTPHICQFELVDWRVAAGECWVVAGQEGSGKTTFIETAAGLNPVLAGELRLFGQTLPRGAGDAMTKLRQRVGVLFAGSGRLFPSLTVLENIALPLRYHRNLTAAEAAAELAPLLEAMRLDRLANQQPTRISRAWARRAGLARALAMRPELLLLDNPLEALDPANSRWWRGFLGELAAGHAWLDRRPATLLIATDELRPLLNLGRKFALAHEGRWRILGDREAVLTSPEPPVREMLFERD